ncbi:MAG TPA: hypothetical protein VFV13_05830 [Acidimicrobiia bacterium]|nr:hypothetical protein [Acidimicrobiia bacterium]
MRDTEPERLGGPLPILDSATPVPVPAPTRPERRSLQWLWGLGVALLMLVTLAAIRGDAPRTAEVAGGAIHPLPESEETALPPDVRAYVDVDPASEDLAVCRWDYCVVHDRIGEERIEHFVYEITPSEAQTIADEVVEDWGVGPVSVTSRALDGDLGGLYDPNTDSITLDEPVVAWSLIHELAHHLVLEQHPATVEGHGDEFLDTLGALAGGP